MKKWSNYILVLGSTLVALLIAECSLRIFVPEIGWAQRKEPIIGWSSDEYQQFDPKSSEDGIETRILFLGDSFLAGSGVSDLDKRFPILLQSQLNDKVSSRILAAGGWGTDQQLLAFMQKGELWAPDLVVLAMCPNNDISNILSHHWGPKNLKSYFVLEKSKRLKLYDGYGKPINYKTIFQTDDVKKGNRRQTIRSYLVDYIRFTLNSPDFSDLSDNNERYRFVDVRYRNFRYWEERWEEINKNQNKLSWSPQNSVNHVSAYIHENFEINTYQWRLFESILTKLKKEVENSGGKLVVVLMPVIFNPKDAETIAGGSFIKRFQTPDGYFTFRSIEPRERLQTISERVGVMFLDPTQDFIRLVVENNWMKEVWPDPQDRHFSDVGHEILAAVTAIVP